MYFRTVFHISLNIPPTKEKEGILCYYLQAHGILCVGSRIEKGGGFPYRTYDDSMVVGIGGILCLLFGVRGPYATHRCKVPPESKTSKILPLRDEYEWTWHPPNTLRRFFQNIQARAFRMFFFFFLHSAKQWDIANSTPSPTLVSSSFCTQLNSGTSQI